MIVTVVAVLVAAAVAFTVGVLFGRKNVKKVEAALAEAKAQLKKVGIDA